MWAALLLAPAVVAPAAATQAAPASPAPAPAAGSVIDAARHGARPGADGATNTRAIQAALDAAGRAGGGTAAITRRGVYDLAVQGPNPYRMGHRYCLDLRYDGLTLLIGPGVTLRLAAGQQTDATGPVDVVVWRARKDLRITGGGTLTGNTARQRGWTGGYSQVTNGTLISGYAETAKGNERVTIEDLTLTDQFSNAVYLSGDPESRDLAVKILGVRARDTGEGVLVMNADLVTLRDVTYENKSVARHPGDGIELWNVADFLVAGATVRGNLGGSGIALYGARHGTVEGFVIEASHEGIAIAGNNAMRSYSERVAVKDGTIRLVRAGTGLFTKGVRVREVTLKAVKVLGVSVPGTIGFQISADNVQRQSTDDWRQEGPVTIEGCEARGLDFGIVIKTVADLTIRGGDYSDNRATSHSDGILWMGERNARSREDMRGLYISGVKATGNRQFGMHVNSEGIPGLAPEGFVGDCALGGNGVEGYHVANSFVPFGSVAVDATCRSFANPRVP